MDEHEMDFSNPREMLAGGLAGMIEHGATFPFDTVKTRMQASRSEFKSTWGCFVHVLRNERWAHFYRGLSPTLVSSFPSHAMYFGVYEATKRALGAGEGTEPTSAVIAFSAAAATLGHDCIAVPFDVVKQRMQVDSAQAFSSSVRCARTLVATGGVHALFASLPATVLMNVPHQMTHWLVYESCKRVFKQPESGAEHTAGFALSGLLAGSAAAMVSTPLDVVKTRVQLGEARSSRDAAQAIVRADGFRGFWRGVVPRVLTLAPQAAISMTSYEVLKSLLIGADVTTAEAASSLVAAAAESAASGAAVAAAAAASRTAQPATTVG